MTLFDGFLLGHHLRCFVSFISYLTFLTIFTPFNEWPMSGCKSVWKRVINVRKRSIIGDKFQKGTISILNWINKTTSGFFLHFKSLNCIGALSSLRSFHAFFSFFTSVSGQSRVENLVTLKYLRLDYFLKSLQSGVREGCLNNLAVFEMDFFQLRQFDYCFQSFFSFGAFMTAHVCSNYAYLILLEFIKGQLKLFMTLPLFVFKKCWWILDFAFFKDYILSYIT